MKQIKWILRHKILSLIIFLIIVFLPPLIINGVYKINAPVEIFNSEWVAGDLLSYYGALLGSIATIIAIIWTISFTVDNQEQERKLSVRPYIQTKWGPVLTTDDLNDNETIVFIEQFKGYFMSYTESPADVFHKNNNLTNRKEKYILKYDLHNIGAGNAINVNISINHIGATLPFGIPMNESKVLAIILDGNLLNNDIIPIAVEIKYDDVSSIARYLQVEKFKLYKNTDGVLNLSQVGDEVLSQPIEVTKD